MTVTTAAITEAKLQHLRVVAAAMRTDPREAFRNPEFFVLVKDVSDPDADSSQQYTLYHCLRLRDGRFGVNFRYEVAHHQSFGNAIKIWVARHAPWTAMLLAIGPDDISSIDGNSDNVSFVDAETLTVHRADHGLEFGYDTDDLLEFILAELKFNAGHFTNLTTRDWSVDGINVYDGVIAIEMMVGAFILIGQHPVTDGTETKPVPRFLVNMLRRSVQDYLVRRAAGEHMRSMSDIWHVAPGMRDIILAILRSAGYEVSDPYAGPVRRS